MTYDHLLFERAGEVTTITLNRPEVHNALEDTFKGYVLDAREQIGMRWELWEAHSGWVGGGTAP